MKYDEFLRQLEQLNEDTDSIDLYTSPDFQCDRTGEHLCADFGIRDCPDIERFNQIVSSLGEDARLTASLYEDNENFNMSM